jgi:hypothetical protein
LPFAAYLSVFLGFFHSLKVPEASALQKCHYFWACASCGRTDKQSNYQSNNSRYPDIDS